MQKLRPTRTSDSAMYKYIADVQFTNEPHVDAGMFDNTEKEWKEQKEVHLGKLLGFSAESQPSDCAKTEIVPVAIILDDENKLRSIPVKRVTILVKETQQ